MANTINRYGRCPNCDQNWDGGDIEAVLKNLDVFEYKHASDLAVIAKESFGYTPENKARFSVVRNVVIKHLGIDAIECPKCHNVWNEDKKYPGFAHLFKSIEGALEEPSLEAPDSVEDWQEQFRKLEAMELEGKINEVVDSGYIPHEKKSSTTTLDFSEASSQEDDVAPF